MKKRSYLRTLMVSALALGTTYAIADDTLTQKIVCKGDFSQRGKKTLHIYVLGNPDKNTLDVSLFQGATPRFFETMSYPITEVLPMFPIYSVRARRDLRPVDGALIEVSLNIETEGISTNGQPGHPSKLQLNTTAWDRLHGQQAHSSKTYQISCQIER